jgi:hypothetical protein
MQDLKVVIMLVVVLAVIKRCISSNAAKMCIPLVLLTILLEPSCPPLPVEAAVLVVDEVALHVFNVAVQTTKQMVVSPQMKKQNNTRLLLPFTLETLQRTPGILTLVQTST